jgi:hypothetical protein
MRPRWGQVREFCRKQGYCETRTDHIRYVKVLPDRSTSGTMVSMGVDGEVVPPQRWRLVWQHQLRLASEDEFWKGLRGESVRYAIPAPVEPAEPLPPYLRHFLSRVLHRTDAEIEAMTRENAQQLWDEYHARELREP